MASVMGAEAALVRIQFVSGTHAISTALSTVLRPGDTLLAVAGKYDTCHERQPFKNTSLRAVYSRPYDTLEEVIGTRGIAGHGSLREWGVDYEELALTETGGVDWDGLATAITPRAYRDSLCSSTNDNIFTRACGFIYLYAHVFKLHVPM